MKPLYALLFGCTIVLLCSGQAPATAGAGRIIRLDPEFDALISKDAKLEKVATGITFTEGPLWRPQGVLWFSDVPGNVVRSLTPSGEVEGDYRTGGRRCCRASGCVYIGPNAMIADKDGTVLCASTATAASYGSAKI